MRIQCPHHQIWGVDLRGEKSRNQSVMYPCKVEGLSFARGWFREQFVYDGNRKLSCYPGGIK